jgi:hypothetical protein
MRHAASKNIETPALDRSRGETFGEDIIRAATQIIGGQGINPFHQQLLHHYHHHRSHSPSTIVVILIAIVDLYSNSYHYSHFIHKNMMRFLIVSMFE